jgi:hypothetical protein
MTVPQEVLDSVTDGERKRQEIIFEIIQTEREFVSDLLLIQKVPYFFYAGERRKHGLTTAT